MIGYPINYGDDVSDRKMLSDYIVDLSGYIVYSAVDAVKNERLQRHLVFGNRKINYQFKLVNQIFNFMNRKIHRTYEITKVISECGVIRKITIGFVTLVFGLGLSFGSSKPVASILQPQPQIERQLQNSISNQPYQAMEGSRSPSVRNLLKISGGDGDLGKNINPGSRARNDARQAFTTRAKGPKPAQSKPGGSGLAEAWSSNHSNRSRPSAANRLAQQFQTGPAEGGNGLFGRFSARPTPDPYNPGCAAGPKSITVRSGQRNSDLFSADSVTGDIQNINIAFNQFKQRMTQIGNQYTGEKQEYFFEQFNQCDIDRFKALSTENGRLTIYGVREAETMLQSEFESYHEPNSITRMTDAESAAKNKLDGRFRKGLLSGESDTLNEEFTDLDAKLLVSDKTLQSQANERKRLGHRNPNKMSMYEQGKEMGYSIVAQKHKHCNPNKPELPSSPDNVKHIVNAIELIPSETEIAKAGILDGARIAWSDKLNVPESSISDQTALQGIICLNENYTIERVN